MLNEFKIEMYGTAEKTESSKYQISLVSLESQDYPRINRYFDNIEERNTFVNNFELSILQLGGKLVHLKRVSHPLFEVFAIVDKSGIVKYKITVYH